MQVISHLDMWLETQIRAEKETLRAYEREQPGYLMDIGVGGCREGVFEEGVFKLTHLTI